MIICLCHNLCDRKIKAYIRQGAFTLKALQKICDVGKSCGQCLEIVKDLCDKKAGLLPENAHDRSDRYDKNGKKRNYSPPQ